MNYYSLFIFFLSLASFASLGVMFIAWTRRQVPGGKVFFLMMAGVLEWTMAYSFQLAMNTLAGKLLWLNLKWFGVLLIPTAWLVFALQYTGRGRWVSAWTVALLSVEPLVMLWLLWSDPGQGHFFRSVELQVVRTGMLLKLESGTGFWINAAYSYLLMLAATCLLGYEVSRTSGRLRLQYVTVLIASLVPWLGNAAWVFRLMPAPHLDYTPFAFTLSGLLILWSFLRHRLLDLVPVARGTLTASLADSMLALDRLDRIVDVNPSAERLMDRPAHALLLQPVHRALGGWPELRDALLDGRQGTREVERGPAGASGRCFDLSTTILRDRRGGFVGTLALLHEITHQKRIEADLRTYKDRLEELVRERTRELEREIAERSRLEEEKGEIERSLRQAEKLEAIGSLAGGIAHDFNNILTAILGFSELSLRQLPGDAPVRGNLKQILQSGKRAKELVEQIIAFTRHSEQKRVPVVLHLVVQEVLPLIRSVFPRTIEIRRRQETGEDRILADPVQIHQVLMNLCTNAAHAMGEGGGVLEITVRRGAPPRGPSADGAGIDPPAPVQLAVSDTGHGMAPAILQQIFEPFFTTKASGEGSGLGLSVVREIVRSHDGEITVSSAPGEGSTFCVSFPLFEGRDSMEAEGAGLLVRGRGRILLVDDEETITQMGKQMLTSLGYEVWTETSGHEALQAFRRSPGRFDLVITDMTMPKMTGLELARQVLALRPGLPVILCTGYHHAVGEERALALGIRELLMKPILFSDLADSVHRALQPGGKTTQATPE